MPQGPTTLPHHVYRFDVTFLPGAAIRVSCGALTANDERTLARKLVAAGCPDGVIDGGRIGRTDWRVRSLHAFAATRLVERDRGFSIEALKPGAGYGGKTNCVLPHLIPPGPPLGAQAGIPRA